MTSTPTLTGIDVSYAQGTVLWQTAKLDGIQFAGIRVSQGLRVRDDQFERNWRTALLRGLPRIAYHYLMPGASGWEQGERFLGCIRRAGGLQAGDALALDLEDLDHQTPARAVQMAEDFVTHVLDYSDVGCLLYTSPNFWNVVLGAPASPILHACSLWVANYGVTQPTPVSGWDSPSFWQYGTTTVKGVTGPVDGDLFFGDSAAYQTVAARSGRGA